MKKLLFLSFILFSIQSFSQAPKGDRILAWQIDKTENDNYDSAFGYAINGCMESIHLSSVWSSIDTNGGDFDQSFIAGFFDVMDIFFPIVGIDVELQIAPINTNVLEMPTDLVGLPFSDLTVINRFKQTLDTVFAHIPNVTLSTLNIGNEHNIYMGSDPLLYNQYKTFLDSVVPYAKQLYFNLHGTSLNVGTTFTLIEMIEPNQAPLCQYVNAGLDVISATYYPQGDTAFFPTITHINDHLDTLINQYPDTSQKIYFTECGFASSTFIGSSEALQADFYSNMFASWDLHSDRLKYLTIFKTTDWSQDEVDTFAVYYGLIDSSFTEFLRTLGVRTYAGDGTNKLAYEAIRCELDARNWCLATTCNTTSLEETKTSQLSLYPNPSDNYISIKLTDFDMEEVLLFNANGKRLKVYNTALNAIDISELSEGVYFIQVSNSIGEKLTKKFLKL